MRLSLRFIVPLILALAGVAYAVVPLVDRFTLRWFVRDLDLRAGLVATTIQDPLLALLTSGSRARTEQYFTRLTQDERLFAIGFCSSRDSSLIATRGFPNEIKCDDLGVFETAAARQLKSSRGALHVSVSPVELDSVHAGSLVLVHDMSFVERRSEETRQYLFYFFVGARRRRLAHHGDHRAAQLARMGAGTARAAARRRLAAAGDERVAGAAADRARSARADPRSRSASICRATGASGSGRRRRCATLLHDELHGNEVIVVSNREPYIHERAGKAIEVQRPASGLVTALEPVMRACSGTWIAHGSGSADREIVDRHDRVAVPPEHPAYQIRRIWLTQGRGSRLLLRIRQRGPVAALPHRARAARRSARPTGSSTRR